MRIVAFGLGWTEVRMLGLIDSRQLTGCHRENVTPEGMGGCEQKKQRILQPTGHVMDREHAVAGTEEEEPDQPLKEHE